MTGLELTRTGDGDTVRLSLRGELDIASAGRLEDALAEIEALTYQQLVIDLRGLDFMDSTGLRIILGADARARVAGRTVTVVRGSDAVTRLFRITGLDERLTIVDAPATV